MNKIWRRDYKLTIRPANGGKDLVYKPPMQVVFNVVGAAADAFQIADIAIYGISKETQNKLYKSGDMLILEVGYDQRLAQIFKGEINNFEIGKDGVSTYIKFYCWSQLRQIAKARIDKSFGNNTPVIELIKGVAGELSGQIEVLGDFTGFSPAIRGETFTANAVEAMRELSQRYDFTWMFLDNKVVVTKNGSAREAVTHDVNAGNGMEGNPRVYTASIEVDVRLNNKIQVHDLLTVSSKYESYGFSDMYIHRSKDVSDFYRVNGKYKVLFISHKGSFYHDTWTTTLGAQIHV